MAMLRCYFKIGDKVWYTDDNRMGTITDIRESYNRRGDPCHKCRVHWEYFIGYEQETMDYCTWVADYQLLPAGLAVTPTKY